MATSKPRITVTLTKRQHEVFQSLSASSGQSMSGLIGEIIEVSMPTFERMAATFQKLKASQDHERSKIAQALDEAQSALEPIALAAVGQFDLFLGRIESGISTACAERNDAPTVEMDATQPPSANRGVTPRKSRQKTGGRNAS